MRDLVVFGLGELGKLYGAGALAAGFRVSPVLRGTSRHNLWTALPEGAPLLIAVSEPSLPSILDGLPAERRADAVLLQNEIFPSLWSTEGEAPTVMVPWILKKPGLPTLVLRATPVYGRHAQVVVAFHQALGIDCKVLGDETELALELAHKYTFILTINALGAGQQHATLSDWVDEDIHQVRAVASEAARLAARLADVTLDLDASLHTVICAMRAMGHVSASGRSAAARVLRAQREALRLGLNLPMLAAIVVQP